MDGWDLDDTGSGSRRTLPEMFDPVAAVSRVLDHPQRRLMFHRTFTGNVNDHPFVGPIDVVYGSHSNMPFIFSSCIISADALPAR